MCASLFYDSRLSLIGNNGLRRSTSCLQLQPRQEHPLTRLSAVEILARVSATVGDVLVLILTWIRTYRQMTEVVRLRQSWPLSARLIRDGEEYISLDSTHG